jgi:hypothetical protein
MIFFPRVAPAGSAGNRTGAQRQVAARVRLREEKIAPAATPPDTAQAGHAFTIRCITGEFGLPHWNGEWRRLLLASQSPEKIYQTPEFFRFLSDSQTSTSDRFELYVITDRVLDKVVGMVPVRLSRVTLNLQVGGITVLPFQPRIVCLLGSVPLMPQEPALLHQLHAHLLASFPDCAAVSMQALPAEMAGYLDADARHAPFVMHGWRACHTIPLPEAWPAYLAKLSAKKRYNLGRQYRLLEQRAGPLTLQRIDRSAHVRDLVDGVAALAGGAPVFMGARDYRVLAANRLLLSYVLRSADDVIAVIAGSRYGDTWHVHQIMYAPAWRHLSPGAVALHAALEDVVSGFAFTAADLGFGKPRHAFASTNVLKTRAHVLLARRGSWAASLLRAFVRLDGFNDACARVVKSLVRRLVR